MNALRDLIHRGNPVDASSASADVYTFALIPVCCEGVPTGYHEARLLIKDNKQAFASASASVEQGQCRWAESWVPTTWKAQLRGPRKKHELQLRLQLQRHGYKGSWLELGKPFVLDVVPLLPKAGGARLSKTPVELIWDLHSPNHGRVSMKADMICTRGSMPALPELSPASETLGSSMPADETQTRSISSTAVLTAEELPSVLAPALPSLPSGSEISFTPATPAEREPEPQAAVAYLPAEETSSMFAQQDSMEACSTGHQASFNDLVLNSMPALEVASSMMGDSLPSGAFNAADLSPTQTAGPPEAAQGVYHHQVPPSFLPEQTAVAPFYSNACPPPPNSPATRAQPGPVQQVARSVAAALEQGDTAAVLNVTAEPHVPLDALLIVPNQHRSSEESGSPEPPATQLSGGQADSRPPSSLLARDSLDIVAAPPGELVLTLGDQVLAATSAAVGSDAEQPRGASAEESTLAAEGAGQVQAGVHVTAQGPAASALFAQISPGGGGASSSTADSSPEQSYSVTPTRSPSPSKAGASSVSGGALMFLPEGEPLVGTFNESSQGLQQSSDSTGTRTSTEQQTPKPGTEFDVSGRLPVLQASALTSNSSLFILGSTSSTSGKLPTPAAPASLAFWLAGMGGEQSQASALEPEAKLWQLAAAHEAPGAAVSSRPPAQASSAPPAKREDEVKAPQAAAVEVQQQALKFANGAQPAALNSSAPASLSFDPFTDAPQDVVLPEDTSKRDQQPEASAGQQVVRLAEPVHSYDDEMPCGAATEAPVASSAPVHHPGAESSYAAHSLAHSDEIPSSQQGADLLSDKAAGLMPLARGWVGNLGHRMGGSHEQEQHVTTPVDQSASIVSSATTTSAVTISPAPAPGESASDLAPSSACIATGGAPVTAADDDNDEAEKSLEVVSVKLAQADQAVARLHEQASLTLAQAAELEARADRLLSVLPADELDPGRVSERAKVAQAVKGVAHMLHQAEQTAAEAQQAEQRADTLLAAPPADGAGVGLAPTGVVAASFGQRLAGGRHGEVHRAMSAGRARSSGRPLPADHMHGEVISKMHTHSSHSSPIRPLLHSAGSLPSFLRQLYVQGLPVQGLSAEMAEQAVAEHAGSKGRGVGGTASGRGSGGYQGSAVRRWLDASCHQSAVCIGTCARAMLQSLQDSHDHPQPVGVLSLMWQLLHQALAQPAASAVVGVALTIAAGYAAAWVTVLHMIRRAFTAPSINEP